MPLNVNKCHMGPFSPKSCIPWISGFLLNVYSFLLLKKHNGWIMDNKDRTFGEHYSRTSRELQEPRLSLVHLEQLDGGDRGLWWTPGASQLSQVKTKMSRKLPEAEKLFDSVSDICNSRGKNSTLGTSSQWLNWKSALPSYTKGAFSVTVFLQISRCPWAPLAQVMAVCLSRPLRHLCMVLKLRLAIPLENVKGPKV